MSVYCYHVDCCLLTVIMLSVDCYHDVCLLLSCCLFTVIMLSHCVRDLTTGSREGRKHASVLPLYLEDEIRINPRKRVSRNQTCLAILICL